MKFRTSLLFFVIFSISGYVSISKGSSAPCEIKKSLAEQLKGVRENDRARRKSLFQEMRDGKKLWTIQEGTCLKKEVHQNMPSFAPLYKSKNHRLSPSDKSALSLLERMHTINTWPDNNSKKNQLTIDESD